MQFATLMNTFITIPPQNIVVKLEVLLISGEEKGEFRPFLLCTSSGRPMRRGHILERGRLADRR